MLQIKQLNKAFSNKQIFKNFNYTDTRSFIDKWRKWKRKVYFGSNYCRIRFKLSRYTHI